MHSELWWKYYKVKDGIKVDLRNKLWAETFWTGLISRSLVEALWLEVLNYLVVSVVTLLHLHLRFNKAKNCKDITYLCISCPESPQLDVILSSRPLYRCVARKVSFSRSSVLTSVKVRHYVKIKFDQFSWWHRTISYLVEWLTLLIRIWEVNMHVGAGVTQSV
jgi:hypothetical protein